MNRSKIIEQLYNDADINAAIKKMQPVELQEDLKQEMFIVICEMTEDRFNDIFEKGYLKFFLVRTMLNMIKSDRSNFYKTFRNNYTEIEKDIVDERYENIEINISETLGCLYWYDREIFSAYINNGKNIKALSRDIGIPYRSLFETIKNVRIKLKKKIRKL